MKRNKFLISTVLEKQDIPSDYCSKLGSEHWRLDRITWDLCAEDCSKSFKMKNHVNSYYTYYICMCTMKWIKLERDILKNGNYLYSTEHKGSEFT